MGGTFSGAKKAGFNRVKDSAFVIAQPLAFINLSLRSGVFPYDWKIAKVKPLHKSGPTNQFDNYRPISKLLKRLCTK